MVLEKSLESPGILSRKVCGNPACSALGPLHMFTEAAGTSRRCVAGSVEHCTGPTHHACQGKVASTHLSSDPEMSNDQGCLCRKSVLGLGARNAHGWNLLPAHSHTPPQKKKKKKKKGMLFFFLLIHFLRTSFFPNISWILTQFAFRFVYLYSFHPEQGM